MPRFEVSPDIAIAKTLSKDFYLDGATFDESKQKIFAPTWQWAGDVQDVGENGAVSPFTLLEGFISEPLMLSRDQKGDLYCLSNVCTHRGNIIIEKPCKVNDLRCKYHGRRFRSDGVFLSMPEFKEVQNFPTESDNLNKLPLHQFGRSIFTSLQPSRPADDFFAEMANRISWMPLDRYEFRPDLSRDYLVNAHWALYCENYLEGFHIPYVHAGLNTVVDYGSYTTELYRYSNLQIGFSRNNETAFDLPGSSPDFGKRVAAYYYWVFPNTMFNFYPWGLSVNIVKPVSLSETKVSFRIYMFDESRFDKSAGADLHGVEMEDEDVVEHVQLGIRSRFYDRGRYSVTREQGTHHFHRLLSEFMNAS